MHKKYLDSVYFEVRHWTDRGEHCPEKGDNLWIVGRFDNPTDAYICAFNALKEDLKQSTHGYPIIDIAVIQPAVQQIIPVGLSTLRELHEQKIEKKIELEV